MSLPNPAIGLTLSLKYVRVKKTSADVKRRTFMKINQQHHFQAESSPMSQTMDGFFSLIQLYASEINFSQLFQEVTPQQLNLEYFEQMLLQELERQPYSAVQEANYEYFKALKQAMTTH